jgi:copper(I)-binding protein
MLMGLSGALKAGENIKGTLMFQNAGAVEVAFRVQPVGASSAGHMHH